MKNIAQEIVKGRKLLLLLFLAFANNDVKNDDTKTDTKQDLIDFDSWTNDRVISKPQDKTAIVKQGIQQLQVVSLKVTLRYLIFRAFRTDAKLRLLIKIDFKVVNIIPHRTSQFIKKICTAPHPTSFYFARTAPHIYVQYGEVKLCPFPYCNNM